jgi:ferredoxin
VTIDTDKCISAGQCVLVAPDVFDHRDEDGLVILLNASASLNQAVDVKQAATLCPALAITIEDLSKLKRVVVRRRVGDRCRSVFGFRGTVTGVLGWNSSREVRALRRLVVDRASWTSVTSPSAVNAVAVR